jgi:hypothetical protein
MLGLLSVRAGLWRHGIPETADLDKQATFSALSPHKTHFLVTLHLTRLPIEARRVQSRFR